MKSSFIYFALMLALGAYRDPAQAHARWKLGSMISPPRNSSTGLKSPPCGGVAKTNPVRTVEAGTQIELEFEETINHPGYYEIYLLDAKDAAIPGYADPLAKVVDTQDGSISNGQYHQYKEKVKLPQIKCENCTLQLIQVMTENPQSPSRYYSCSDINIVEPPPIPTTTSGAVINGSKPPKPLNLKIQRMQ